MQAKPKTGKKVEELTIDVGVAVIKKPYDSIHDWMRDAPVYGGSEFGLGPFLFGLVTSTNAKQVLEIGRYRGFSTAVIASALKFLDKGWTIPEVQKQRPDINYDVFLAPQPRLLTSVDVEKADVSSGLRSLELFNYVDQITADSKTWTTDKVFDFVFVDGDHNEDGIWSDVNRFCLSPKLRPGGYFVLHDYFGWYEGTKNGSAVAKVCQELYKRIDLEHTLIDTGFMSLVLFRKL